MADSNLIKPLASMATLERLQLEAEELMDQLDAEDQAVGDAVMVRYDRVWASEHGIGRFGRMTYKTGKPVFHACPSKIDRNQIYKMPDESVFTWAKSWASGGGVPPPVDHLVNLTAVPQKQEIKRSLSIRDYERALFLRIYPHSDITLINPSFGSMVELKAVGGGYVHLPAGTKDAWGMEVVDFVKKSDGLLHMSPKIIGAAYLGTNIPKFYPALNWFRLIVSPFQDPRSMFQNFSVDWRDDHVICTYQKKLNYEVTSVLQRDRPYYVFNPATVDNALFRRNTGQSFFAEASWNMMEKDDIEDTKMRHAPWFITIEGEWLKNPHDGMTWRVRKDNFVTDVKGSGTYLSRRARYTPPEGCQWLPLQTSGTHWVTYSTNNPQRMPGVTCGSQGQAQMMLFDNLTPITGLRSEYTSQTHFYGSGDPPLSGVVVPLRCDESLFSCTGGQPSPTTIVHAHVLADASNSYYLPTQLTETGIIFVPDKLSKMRPLPLLPTGNIKKTRCIVTAQREYIETDNVAPGINFLFRSLETVSRLGATLTGFGGNWMNMERQRPEEQSTAYGGMVNANHTLNAVLDVVTRRVMTSDTSDAYTASQIAYFSQVSMTIVHYYCARYNRIKLWRGFSDDKLQYVHVDCLSLCIPGQRTRLLQDDMIIIDGMSWKEVLSLIEDDRVRRLVCTRGVLTFREFLVRNNYSVHLVTRGHYFVLKIYV